MSTPNKTVIKISNKIEKNKFGLTIRRYMAEILPIRRKTFSGHAIIEQRPIFIEYSL